jgi:hypothetical protein
VAKFVDLMFEGLLKDTVEGSPTSMSLAFTAGEFHIGDEISEGAKPNLQILAQFLRSGGEISPKVRLWLAELCDPDAKSDMTLVLKKRRSGRPKVTMMKHLAAVQEFRQLNAPHAFHAAILQVMNEYGITHSTLIKAIKLLGPYPSGGSRLSPRV